MDFAPFLKSNSDRFRQETGVRGQLSSGLDFTSKRGTVELENNSRPCKNFVCLVKLQADEFRLVGKQCLSETAPTKNNMRLVGQLFELCCFVRFCCSIVKFWLSAHICLHTAGICVVHYDRIYEIIVRVPFLNNFLIKYYFLPLPAGFSSGNLTFDTRQYSAL